MALRTNHRIGLYVPSTVNGNEVASAEMIEGWVKAAKKKFADLFGGFTVYRGEGGWLSPTFGLIEEPVTIITAHTDEAGLGNVPEVRTLAATVAEALGQEAVTVEVDNELQFVGPALAAV